MDAAAVQARVQTPPTLAQKVRAVRAHPWYQDLLHATEVKYGPAFVRYAPRESLLAAMGRISARRSEHIHTKLAPFRNAVAEDPEAPTAENVREALRQDGASGSPKRQALLGRQQDLLSRHVECSELTKTILPWHTGALVIGNAWDASYCTAPAAARSQLRRARSLLTEAAQLLAHEDPEAYLPADLEEFCKDGEFEAVLAFEEVEDFIDNDVFHHDWALEVVDGWMREGRLTLPSECALWIELVTHGLAELCALTEEERLTTRGEVRREVAEQLIRSALLWFPDDDDI